MAPNAEPPRQLGVGLDHQTSRLTGVRRAKNSPIDSPHVWSRAASAPSGHPTAASMPAALMTVRFVGPEVLAPRASWPRKRVPARARTEESQGRQPRVLLVAHPAARRSPAIERFCIGIGRSPLLTGYFIGRPKARARHRSMRRSLHRRSVAQRTCAWATSESRRSSRTGAGLTIAFAPAGLRRRRRARLRNATASVVSPRRADGCLTPAMHQPSCPKAGGIRRAIALLYASADPSRPGRSSGLARPRDSFARIEGWLSLAGWPSSG